MINDITGCALLFIGAVMLVKPWEKFEAWFTNKCLTSNWDRGGW